MTHIKQNRMAEDNHRVSLRGDILAVVFLALLVLAALSPMVLFDRISLQNDNINVNFARYSFIHSELRAGRVPTWDPLVLCGTPVESFYVPSNPYNPILMPAMLIRDPISSYMFLLSFWMTLLAVFFYIFARAALRLGVAPSLAGAAVFALNGFVIARLEHPSCIAVVLWTPLVLTGVIKWLRDRRPFWIFFISFASAMQFFGSHILYSSMCFMLAFFVWMFWNYIRESGTPGRDIRGLAGILAGIILGVAAAAIALGPFYAHAAGAERASWHFKTSVLGELGFRSVIAFFLPGVFGSYFNYTNWTEGAYWHEASGYVGLAVALLVFVVGRKHLGRTGRFFALVAVFGALVSFGTATPAGLLLLNLPILNSFEFPGRYLFFWVFGMSAATAIALNGLLKVEIPASKKLWITAAAMTAAAIVLYAFPGPILGAGRVSLSVLLNDPRGFSIAGKFLGGAGVHDAAFYLNKFATEVFPSVRMSLVGAFLNIAAVAVLLALHNRMRRTIGYMWTVMLFLSLCQVVSILVKYSPADILRKPPSYLSAVTGDIGDMRLMPATQIPTNKFVWPYSLETDTMYGVSISKGYEHFHPLSAKGFPEWNKDCRYYGAKYMTLPEGEKLSFPNCSSGKLVGVFDPDKATESKDKINVFTVKDPLPVAYIAHDFIAATKQKEIESIARRPGFDPLKTVIVDREIGIDMSLPPGVQPDAADDKVDLERPSPDSVRIHSYSARPGVLALLDTYFDGWTATVDGKRAPVLRAFKGFKAVPLAAGSHEIVFTYRPVVFMKCLPVSVIAWIAIFIGIIVSVFSGKTRDNNSGHTHRKP